MLLLKRAQKGFTLVELIVSMTIFVILATVSVVLISNVSKTSRKVEMEEYLYTETQALLERMAREIQISAIDYEEYYNQNILGASYNAVNYGSYQANFFQPGQNGYNTYQNPYASEANPPPEQANAMCGPDINCVNQFEDHHTHAIFLLSRTGNEKTLFVMEENALSMVKLRGIDNDGNGISETWTCGDEFECTSENPEHPGDARYTLPDPMDVMDGVRDTTDFTPITPQNIKINEFSVYLSPIEDPFMAVGEATPETFNNVQIHPKITIVIQAEYRLLSDSGAEIPFEDSGDFIGSAPQITLQTTLGTGIYNEIPTYTPSSS